MAKKKNNKKLKSTIGLIFGVFMIALVLVFTFKAIDKVKVTEVGNKGSSYVVMGKWNKYGELSYKVIKAEKIDKQSAGVVLGKENEEDDNIRLAVTYKVRNDITEDLTYRDSYEMQLHNEVRSIRYDSTLTNSYLKSNPNIKSSRPTKLLAGEEYQMTLVYEVNKNRYASGQVSGLVGGTYYYLK